MSKTKTALALSALAALLVSSLTIDSSPIDVISHAQASGQQGGQGMGGRGGPPDGKGGPPEVRGGKEAPAVKEVPTVKEVKEVPTVREVPTDRGSRGAEAADRGSRAAEAADRGSRGAEAAERGSRGAEAADRGSRASDAADRASKADVGEKGQRGPSADSDAKGPKYGGPGTGQGDESHGGKPVWAQEGIPEVELGRLNVMRAPSQVFERQFAEAEKAVALDPTLLDFYTMSVEEIQAADLDTITRLDSPLANIAILKVLLKDPDGTITIGGQELVRTPTTVAILIASASDKTVPITTDTVIAIYTVTGVSITPEEAAAIAAEAELVRVEIQNDHDN